MRGALAAVQSADTGLPFRLESVHDVANKAANQDPAFGEQV